MAKSPARDLEKFKKRVQARLKALDRTQKQVDETCGWTAGTLSRVLGGRKPITPELLEALAAALECPVDTLTDGTAWAGVEGVSERGPAVAPTPAPIPAAPAPAPEPVPEPTVHTGGDDAAPSGEPRRRRKRDLPLNVLRYIAGKLLGG